MERPGSAEPGQPGRLHPGAETITPRYGAFVLTGAYTGLRPGELAALRTDRLDLPRRLLIAHTAQDSKPLGPDLSQTPR